MRCTNSSVEAKNIPISTRTLTNGAVGYLQEDEFYSLQPGLIGRCAILTAYGNKVLLGV